MVLSLIVAAFPMTTHEIHILHQSWIFDTMFAVFKPLIDSRMNAKIFFHGSDMESLHRHLPPECLPKKYGGIREELPYYRWIESLSKDPRVVKEMKSLGYVIPDEICQQKKDEWCVTPSDKPPPAFVFRFLSLGEEKEILQRGRLTRRRSREVDVVSWIMHFEISAIFWSWDSSRLISSLDSLCVAHSIEK